MTTANSQQRWNIKRDPGYLNMALILLFFYCERFELNRVLNNPVRRFPAADVLMLVPAAHMG
jgi:hypothetical protein